MEEAVPILNIGYIKFNTNYIPNAIPELADHCKTTWDGGPLESALCIKSNISIELDIGGSIFTLKEGHHYIPSLAIYHNTKLITDIKCHNPENVEIYHKCIFDDTNLRRILSMYTVNVDSLEYKQNPNLKAIFRHGMCGYCENVNDNIDKLNEFVTSMKDIKYTQLSNPNAKLLKQFRCNINELLTYCSWLNISKYDKESEYYAQFIYHINIDLVQKDKEITDLLYKYDKDFVRHSYPPCILIMYCDDNYDKVKKLLKKKYNIHLKTGDAVSSYANKSYEELKHEIIEHNNKIKYYESIGAFEFVKQISIPFDNEFYEVLTEP